MCLYSFHIKKTQYGLHIFHFWPLPLRPRVAGPPGAKAGKWKNDQSCTNVAPQMAWRTSVVPRWYHFGTNVAPQKVEKVPIVVSFNCKTTLGHPFVQLLVRSWPLAPQVLFYR